jgi:hypothetical protein
MPSVSSSRARIPRRTGRVKRWVSSPSPAAIPSFFSQSSTARRQSSAASPVRTKTVGTLSKQKAARVCVVGFPVRSLLEAVNASPDSSHSSGNGSQNCAAMKQHTSSARKSSSAGRTSTRTRKPVGAGPQVRCLRPERRVRGVSRALQDLRRPSGPGRREPRRPSRRRREWRGLPVLSRSFRLHRRSRGSQGVPPKRP